jgi:hypothetical protein
VKKPYGGNFNFDEETRDFIKSVQLRLKNNPVKIEPLAKKLRGFVDYEKEPRWDFRSEDL